MSYTPEERAVKDKAERKGFTFRKLPTPEGHTERWYRIRELFDPKGLWDSGPLSFIDSTLEWFGEVEKARTR